MTPRKFEIRCPFPYYMGNKSDTYLIQKVDESVLQESLQHARDMGHLEAYAVLLPDEG